MNIDHSLGFIINHAGRRLSHLLSLHYQPYAITTEQWTVLNRLAEQDGISQKDLAQRAEKDQTNITRILDQLERKGLVERRPNAVDRRSFLTFITDKGKSVNEVLLPVEKEVINSALQGLSKEEIDLLRVMLNRITRNANRIINEVEEQL
ncbi:MULTISPECIES: MarR family transcriptional regulator [unclassified Paenibacillus]|uniref:MarR family winged helix-turn-helix transcriptional regulator n=1 Tax=unclassified Paenibacillus TaxID=185978 RepID=UPI001AE3EE4B|nr:MULTISPECIES: MarR family transcriptional regulator [unclassified Paenibacillus]MBP1153321.1 DNA-binding MarR family transcriptional regulator [Paenibacillus sp. PvP091]MBP1171296.1 DNA-binding MarR family transcriptional regulator [Paenibacillus sp. PvR098]MBP2442324.1 DNA-binding MarR family transcriptional regulator [Paenibacillus sp. PvP052]